MNRISQNIENFRLIKKYAKINVNKAENLYYCRRLSLQMERTVKLAKGIINKY